MDDKIKNKVEEAILPMGFKYSTCIGTHDMEGITNIYVSSMYPNYRFKYSLKNRKWIFINTKTSELCSGILIDKNLSLDKYIETMISRIKLIINYRQ